MQHNTHATLFSKPRQTENKLDYLLDRDTKYIDYKRIISECDPSHMQAWIKLSHCTPFHSTFDSNEQIAILKMKCLVEHATRLGMDINASFNPIGMGLPEHAVWNNTPLHLWIANECHELVKAFLEGVKQYDLQVNLNLKDREGKTPLMLAIKMGNVPFEAISLLISEENFNMPDDTGVTPLMMACAMRRIDIAQLIIQQEARRLALGELDFDHLSEHQRQRLHDFINQQHPETKKTLGHFALMRCGVDEELMKPNTYQQTILNLAKSVGIDARRDKNAAANAATNDEGAQARASQEEIGFYNSAKTNKILMLQGLENFGLAKDLSQTGLVFTDLSYRGVDKVEHALLASKDNNFMLMSKTRSNNAHLYTKIPEQIKQYSGISFAESIMQRTNETIQFLVSMGLDFSLRQTQDDKTPADYVQVLQKPANKQHITQADKKYLFPLVRQLKELATQQRNVIAPQTKTFSH